jgi:purine nucleoside permease
LYYKDGVALYVTGMGKAQSAVSFAACLLDPRFDWSDTFVITTGCAGSSSETTVLGDVVLASVLIDHELGHSVDPRDAPAGAKLFYRVKDFDSAAYYEVPAAKRAFDLCKDLKLAQSEKAKKVMALYGNTRPPEVLTGGITLSGDDYWGGKHSHDIAKEIISAYTDMPFMITEMEDVALAMTHYRFYGNLDRFLSIRDSVNMDGPPPGVDITAMWKESSGTGADYDGGNWIESRENNFTVGKVVIDAVLSGRF